MADPEHRVGGMALANGLLVHSRGHWAAAIRDRDDRLIVASGPKPRLVRGPLGRIPLLRGVLRLAEGVAILPALRRALPESRFAFEEGSALKVLVGSTALAALARRGSRSVVTGEVVGATVGLMPMLVALRGSRAAVWHAVEHKSIAAYEAGGPDEVAHAGNHAKEHPRCGSNLVLPMVLTSGVVNVAIRGLGRRAGAPVRLIGAGVALGAAVEMFAFADRRPGHPVARFIHGAGHAIQAGFVTREPEERDMVVGRRAMEELFEAEGIVPAR